MAKNIFLHHHPDMIDTAKAMGGEYYAFKKADFQKFVNQILWHQRQSCLKNCFTAPAMLFEPHPLKIKDAPQPIHIIKNIQL